MDLFSLLTPIEKKQSKLRGIISAAIKDKRNESNMSQKELAIKLGISQGMISKLESTEYNISVDNLIELLESLDIEYDININGKNCISNNNPKFDNFYFKVNRSKWKATCSLGEYSSQDLQIA